MSKVYSDAKDALDGILFDNIPCICTDYSMQIVEDTRKIQFVGKELIK